MKVIATAFGYFDCLREIGDVFDVPDGAQAKWFVPVNVPEAVEKPKRFAPSKKEKVAS